MEIALLDYRSASLKKRRGAGEGGWPTETGSFFNELTRLLPRFIHADYEAASGNRSREKIASPLSSPPRAEPRELNTRVPVPRYLTDAVFNWRFPGSIDDVRSSRAVLERPRTETIAFQRTERVRSFERHAFHSRTRPLGPQKSRIRRISSARAINYSARERNSFLSASISLFAAKEKRKGHATRRR